MTLSLSDGFQGSSCGVVGLPRNIIQDHKAFPCTPRKHWTATATPIIVIIFIKAVIIIIVVVIGWWWRGRCRWIKNQTSWRKVSSLHRERSPQEQIQIQSYYCSWVWKLQGNEFRGTPSTLIKNPPPLSISWFLLLLKSGFCVWRDDFINWENKIRISRLGWET